jgi:hypothetical protein
MGFLDSLAKSFQEARGQKPAPTPAAETPAKVLQQPVYRPPAPASTSVSPNINITTPQPSTESRIITSQQIPQQSYQEENWKFVPKATKEMQQKYELEKLNLSYDPIQRQIQDQMLKEAEAEKLKMDEIEARAREAYDKMQDASKFGGYWSDKNTGSKILAGLGIMLGSVGSAMAGRKNSVLETIDREIERDMQRKKLRIEAQMKVIEKSKVDYDIKAKKIAKLEKQMQDVESGEAYALVASKAREIAQKTGKIDHAQLAEYLGKAAMVSIAKKQKEFLEKELGADTLKKRVYAEPGTPLELKKTEKVERTKSPGTDDPMKQIEMAAKLQTMARTPLINGLKGLAIDANKLVELLDVAIEKKLAGEDNPFYDVMAKMQGAKAVQKDDTAVREYESRIFDQAGGVLDNLMNMVNKVQYGGQFTENQYKLLRQAMRSYATLMARAYNTEISPIVRVMKTNNMDFHSVFSTGNVYYDEMSEHDDDRIKWHRDMKAKAAKRKAEAEAKKAQAARAAARKKVNEGVKSKKK